jgi:hypothetical protein
MEKLKKWNFRTNLFPRVYTESALLHLLAVKKRDYLLLTADKKKLCVIVHEPKKSGGTRTIYKPSHKLKWLLKLLNKRYLSRLEFPNFVHCGPDGRSILTAVKGHNLYKYHLSLDITAFFDSVSESTLRTVFKNTGINKAISLFLIRASVEDNQLPQGFPTSSLLSALVVSSLLEDFYTYMAGEVILLSVYADDIIISANDKQTHLKPTNFIESRLKPHGLNLKSEKEHLVRNGEKFTWLGLQVYPWIALPRKELLAIEKRVYEYKVYGIIPKDFTPKKKPKNEAELREAYGASLNGQINFARSINKNTLPVKARKKLDA